MILILFGLFFVFYIVIAKLLSEECDGFFIAVEGYEGKENLSSEVYSAYIQVNMMNFGEKKPVCVVDYGLSEETKENLKETVGEYGKVVFLKIEDNCLKEE